MALQVGVGGRECWQRIGEILHASGGANLSKCFLIVGGRGVVSIESGEGGIVITLIVKTIVEARGTDEAIAHACSVEGVGSGEVVVESC